MAAKKSEKADFAPLGGENPSPDPLTNGTYPQSPEKPATGPSPGPSPSPTQDPGLAPAPSTPLPRGRRGSSPAAIGPWASGVAAVGTELGTQECLALLEEAGIRRLRTPIEMVQARPTNPDTEMEDQEPSLPQASWFQPSLPQASTLQQTLPRVELKKGNKRAAVSPISPTPVRLSQQLQQQLQQPQQEMRQQLQQLQQLQLQQQLQLEQQLEQLQQQLQQQQEQQLLQLQQQLQRQLQQSKPQPDPLTEKARGHLQRALQALKEAHSVRPLYKTLIEDIEKAIKETQGPQQPAWQPAKQPKKGLQGSTYASVAATNIRAPAQVAAKPASKAPPKASAKAPNKKNAREDFQVILKLQRGAPTPEIKPIELRNKLNEALKDIAILALSTSDRGNIVITTKAPYTAKKLLEEKAKWAPLLKELPIESADLPTSWTKLVAKGVPNLEEMATLDIFAAEAMTFSGVKVLGQPRWLRTPGPNQRAGSVVFAVPSEAVGAQCRKEGLYVAGVKLRVEAYKEYTIRTQCYRCLSFGHNPRTCRRPVRCAFCSEKHLTRDHSCPSSYNVMTPIPVTSFPKLNKRPRVIAYKRKEALVEASTSFDLFCDPDIQAIRVEGTEPFILINLYNEKEVMRAPASQPGAYTVERLLLTARLPQQPFLLVGDFNLHHPRWNPSVEASRARKAEALISWLDRYKASLLTDLEVATEGTYWREGLKGVSLIDLAFYSPFKQLTWTNFRFLDATGSDHKPIAFEASPRNPSRPLAARPATYNYKKADWKAFSEHLAKKEQDVLTAIERAITRDNLEGIARLLTRTLIEASNAAIPKKRPYEGSKPWWTDELTSLRKALGLAQRAYRLLRDEESHEAFLKARNNFKYAIRAAKKKHWESFLAEAVGKDVFTAFSYTKARVNPTLPSLSYKKGGVEAKANTFTEKCEAFLTTLFPTPDPSPGPSPPSPPQSLETEPPGRSGSKGKAMWDWPELEDPEIRRAIVSSSNKKAPGPDSLSFLPIQYAYKAIPTVFNKAYKALFDRGYHPKAWKEAIGIILPKLNKPDYSVPKAYRVISLLNCLGKTLEKLYATRLSYLANTTGLLSPSQLGGRKQRSAIDTALLLLHHIQKEQESNKRAITSTLLLDIKGAFDYVSKEQLLRVLEGLDLPRALISWVGHFLTGRKIQLAFEGQIQPLTDLETGVPQGSPISPILFLLYIRGILAAKGYQLSYIDDFSISITSTSAKKNTRQLEAIASSLFEQAKEQGVQFDPSKTELIHFSRQREPILEGIWVGGLFFEAKPLVKWLGVFFNHRLQFKEHIDAKVKAAQAAFEGLSRLVSMQKGLSFRASRQLYQACIATIADYGAQLWYKGPKTPRSLLKPFQRLQNQALLKVLGAFKGSPIRALEAEAALPPPEVRFEKACLSYALRTLYLLPSHPIRQAYNLAVRDELADSGSDLGALSYIRPYTQLFRLLNALVDVIGPNFSLERRKASWEPPWALEPKTSILIEEVPKPIAKKRHLQLLASLADPFRPGPPPLAYYTDGSKGRPKGSLIETNACSFCELGPENRPNKVHYENLGPSVEVADAELFAILRVLEDLARRPRPPTLSPSNPLIEAYIFIDSQAAIQKVKRYSDLAIRVRRLLTSLEAFYNVQLHWCPSHVGIFGNELADQLAKKGLGAPLQGTPIVSISHLRRKTRQATRDHWKGLWAAEAAKGPKAKGLGTHYQSIRKTPRLALSPEKGLIQPRVTLSAFFQLLFGAGFFFSFLKRIKKVERDRCRCGGRHTVEHLILRCPNYRREREALYMAFRRRKEALSLTYLYNSKEGRGALLAFLAKTEIGTAKWLENE
ncbi:hypothetical protein HIM_09144 [Hirsutella minnesotensis 3608]|uniref:Reverse transcriptase n=1 Tax=Hirsutella minnesotensis 3608 TaxID=1043627 RepID=A0A0F7ZSJ2_9HYPO|nr:hypothetical protein HIM_09144 [Hirsutella minnesotensis 3608]